jgi:putrescine transport system permease protein
MESKWGKYASVLVLLVGFLFLYVPILVLIIYSFNESRLVTVWAGFSGKWYAELFNDRQLMRALWVSLQIGFGSATTAVVLGTMAAMALVRLGAFHGRGLLAGMLAAPLVMPEVITGLSMLLLFVSLAQWLGWPANRGMMTIWIAHSTFGMAYVAVVVGSRLRSFDHNLEDAAMDLGAGRIKVFFVITLPLIAPALFTAWMLAFTLSLDDLVIASFVSGPGASTLPMEVFSSVRMGVSPKVNALSALLIGAASCFTFTIWGLLWRQERRLLRRRAQQWQTDSAAD